MTRFALALACLLSACVLEEATEADIAEVESESATAPTIVELFDEQPITIAAGANSIRYYKIVVPAGFDHVSLYRNGWYSGSAAFYMRLGAMPTTTAYDCHSTYANTCKIDYPPAGTYYVMVVAGTAGYSNLSFEADYRNSYAPIANNFSYTFWNQYGFDQLYKLSVPTNVSSVSFTYTLAPDDDGRLDLVVKRGRFATDVVYDCIKFVNWYQDTYSATCTFTNPPAGTYYIGLLGYNTKVVGTFTARYRLALFGDGPLTSTTN